MSFSKHPDSDAVCYTKPLDSLKCWKDHFFWVNSFAFPASFPWHTEPFLCLIGMSRNYTMYEDTYPTFIHDDGTEMSLLGFIQVADPTKVKVGERERAEEEARILDSTVRRVVLLLPVAPARADSELEKSVDRLFDEGGSADQGYSTAGGGQETETEIVTGVRFVADENVVTEKPKRPRKKRQAATVAGGSFHPPKKLRGDHETSSGAATGGKSPSVHKELLASSMLNVEVGVVTVVTLPMITSSVSTTLEHESCAPADSINGLNLCTLGESERFVISLDSSHHSSTNASEAGVDSFVRSVVLPPVMTEAVITTNVASIPFAPALKTGTKVISPVHASMFHDSDSTGTISEMDYHHLFTEFNVGNARQACLNAEVRMRTEYCLSERKRRQSSTTKATRLRVQVAVAKAMEKMHVDEIDTLKQKNVVLENEKESLDGKVTELQSLVSTKDLELKDLNVVVSSLRSQKDSLVDQVSGFEQLKEQIKEFQDAQMNIVNDMAAKLDADLLEMALHLEEKFYPHLLTTISGQRWLLTHGLKLAVVKCLSSQEYLSALGAAISRTFKKGMQEGLLAGIDHGKAGRSLADVVAYNLAAEADYNSSLQRLCEVDFSLLAELKSHKDASVDDIMNLLRVEGPLADARGMSDLQPHVDQLMLPVHRSEDQVVQGKTSLSFSLSVTHSRVKRIRENVSVKRSALIGVWTPLVDLLSVENLTGEAGTSDGVPVTTATTTALSTTFASASSVPPITIEDYEIISMDGPEDAHGNGPFADAPGMSNLQPDVEQLTLHIYCLEDQVVLGETSLSFALSVTRSRVEWIRENVAAQRSTLIDVWVPLVDPLSAKSMICKASTSGSVPAAVVTTIAL
ncbi:gypsy type transposase [Tanacetum coccineum]